MRMKGKTELTRIFKPLSVRQNEKSAKVDLSLQSRSTVRVSAQAALLTGAGLLQELALLRDMLKRDSGPMVLTGERGSGKSALVEVC